MAVTLGKRKRRDVIRSQSPTGSDRSGSMDDAAARALFQKAFEAKFKPLEKIENEVEENKDLTQADSAGEESLESEWDGISDDDDSTVEVVDIVEPQYSNPQDRLAGKKAFMSAKPPQADKKQRLVTKAKKSGAPEDDQEEGDEAANLKNDLELQRLLKESHLLGPSSFHNSTSVSDGKSRLQALDLRLRDLGAKSSVLHQEKMPLSHRKGINAKNTSRAANRRKEAAENGVILEKARAVSKAPQRRERGIGGPGMGKFRGGTLTLSSRDVQSIQGSKSSGPARKARKRRSAP